MAKAYDCDVAVVGAGQEAQSDHGQAMSVGVFGQHRRDSEESPSVVGAILAVILCRSLELRHPQRRRARITEFVLHVASFPIELFYLCADDLRGRKSPWRVPLQPQGDFGCEFLQAAGIQRPLSLQVIQQQKDFADDVAPPIFLL